MKNRNRSIQNVLVIVCTAISILILSPAAFADDTEMPEYEARQQLAASLSSVGSDSMDELLNQWVKAYSVYQPNSHIRIQSRGSASAPPALIDGASDFGPMSREIKKSEREQFLTELGFEPTEINTASVALGVYVSEKNPLSEVSFETLERIYSSKPKQASNTDVIKKWSDITPEFKNSVIAIIQTEHEQETNLFRQRVLSQLPYGKSVKRNLGKETAVKLARMNPGSIMIAPLYDRVPEGLKLLKVKETDLSQGLMPTAGIEKYPLSRYLNIYLVREPGQDLETPIGDFLKFVLSAQGQKLVADSGLTPLSAEAVVEQRKKLL